MKIKVLLFCLLGLASPVSTLAQNQNYTPLHWAAAQGYVEMMQVLVNKGYNINAQDTNGFTPLHYAAASGKFSGVEFLVNKGADLYLVNIDNLTPMSLAAQAGEQKVVDFLFVKMRSTRVDQLKSQAEKARVNSDLAQAAKARVEAERLRQQASEWTKEANFWRAEAQKWTREANLLKEKQVQVDKLAQERLQQAILEKQNAVTSFEAERAARTAAERLLREQGANLDAQIKAYQAQNAALSAQQATDAAIENLAEEFLRQGMPLNNSAYSSGSVQSQLPSIFTNKDGQVYFIDPNAPSVPVNILATTPTLNASANFELPAQPNTINRNQDVVIDPGLLQFGAGVAPERFEESITFIEDVPEPEPVIVEPEPEPEPVIVEEPVEEIVEEVPLPIQEYDEYADVFEDVAEVAGYAYDAYDGY